jgi:rubrerythrin
VEKEKKIEILKSAMILERKGLAFYTKLADEAKDENLKNLFEMLANDEVEHFETLKKQYLSLKKDSKFTVLLSHPKDREHLVSVVLSSELMNKLSKVTFETAAIHGALLFEKNAIDYYSKCYEEASDPEEKKLFEWLSVWEADHLKFLEELDTRIKDEILSTSDEWPFSNS